jgi:hypothetical protein
MPRSIQDILDHADELAARFENYEPDPSDERTVEEYLLERAALARARSERQIVDAITAARSKQVSWTRIGELLGTSAQAAQQRYGNRHHQLISSGNPSTDVPICDGLVASVDSLICATRARVTCV